MAQTGAPPSGMALENAQLPSGRIEKVFLGRQQLHQKIRDTLAAMHEIHGEYKTDLPESLKKIIVVNQPTSGDFLLSIIANSRDELHHRAVNAFVQTWDTMNVQQIDTYFQRAIELKVHHRARYPQGAGAWVRMSYKIAYCWGGWPLQSDPKLNTLSRHFVDGKIYGEVPYGRTFLYSGPMATTGWIEIEDLSLGRHTAHMEFEYEFTHHGVVYQNRMQSKKFSFDVVAGSTPDDLIAPSSPELDAMVRAAFHVSQKRKDLEKQLSPGAPDSGDTPEHWQSNGRMANGETFKSIAPVWGVSQALPVDLLFEVEIHDLSNGKIYKGNPIELKSGEKTQGILLPDDEKFALGRNGTILVKYVLKPSRAMALSRPWTTRYYPGTLVFEGMGIRVESHPGPPINQETKRD